MFVYYENLKNVSFIIIVKQAIWVQNKGKMQKQNKFLENKNKNVANGILLFLKRIPSYFFVSYLI